MSYLEDLFSLEGQTAIVAGGAGVIGVSMSQALLKAGAKIAVWSRTQTSIDHALDQLNRVGGASGSTFGCRVDTGVEAEVREALKATETALTTPKILINAVGGNLGKAPFIQSDLEQFEKVLKLNLIAGLMVPQIAARYLQTDHGGLGILLGGAPGVPPAEVTVIGAGIVGLLAGLMLFLAARTWRTAFVAGARRYGMPARSDAQPTRAVDQSTSAASNRPARTSTRACRTRTDRASPQRCIISSVSSRSVRTRRPPASKMRRSARCARPSGPRS